MTHAEIIKKFMIEYDKADVTSSFPSLTKYEICTLLNKAYLALISLKITGANSRKAPFESDIKSVEDVRPLIDRSQSDEASEYTTSAGNPVYIKLNTVSNEVTFPIPANSYYIIDAQIFGVTNKWQSMQMIPHAAAKQYKVSDTNFPWIKNPVYVVEGKFIHAYIDKYLWNKEKRKMQVMFTYIKKPAEFTILSSNTVFELNDNVAEELISLAIAFGLETVESPRLQTKLNTLPLES